MSYIAQSGTDAYTPTQLILGDADIVTDSITVLSGENLAANTVVGRVTASGKIVECDLGAADGSEVPLGILVNAVDASAGDKAGNIYIGGEFNRDLLAWHTSFATDLLKDAAFDGTNIAIKTPTYSVG